MTMNDKLKKFGGELRKQAQEHEVEIKILKSRNDLDKVDTDPNSATFGKTRREALGPIVWSTGFLQDDRPEQPSVCAIDSAGEKAKNANEKLLQKALSETEVFADDSETLCRAFVAVYADTLRTEPNKAKRAALWLKIAGVAIRQVAKAEGESNDPT
jgi:hypothetical protein